ncbi:hypothetical protein KKA14_09960 [bacterium]|nr:hypothetical protein [bacterium]
MLSPDNHLINLNLNLIMSPDFISTNDQESVSKFSLLMMSENHGTVIREVSPPKT